MVHMEPSLPWLMALSIGQDLVTPDLADDDPDGIHAQRRAGRARAMVIAPSPSVLGFAGLQRDHVRGAGSRKAIEPQLQRVLDGEEPLGGRDLAGQGPQQGGLAGVGAAGDDDVRFAVGHGGSQERQQGRASMVPSSTRSARAIWRLPVAAVRLRLGRPRRS